MSNGKTEEGAVTAHEPEDRSRPDEEAGEGAREHSVAASAVIAAARRLPPADRYETVEAMLDQLADEALTERHRLGRHLSRRRRAVEALRAVAELIGRPPTEGEYRSKARCWEDRSPGVVLPTAEDIIALFGSWFRAAIAAFDPDSVAVRLPALVPEARKVRQYSEGRLLHCLQVCAAEIDAVPTTRSYLRWRAVRLRAQAGPTIDIPHYTTIREHFGGWNAALRAAGLNGGRYEWPDGSGERSAAPLMGCVAARRDSIDG